MNTQHLCTLEWHPAGFEVACEHAVETPPEGLNRTSALAFTRDLIEKDRHLYGLPDFIESPWFSTEDFAVLIANIKRERLDQVALATKVSQPWLELLNTKGFSLALVEASSQQWHTVCPFGKGHHFLMISLKTYTWGCGYCRRKGALSELLR
jgi:hypothetical protein